jgi:hypothetical protein
VVVTHDSGARVYACIFVFQNDIEIAFFYPKWIAKLIFLSYLGNLFIRPVF